MSGLPQTSKYIWYFIWYDLWGENIAKKGYWRPETINKWPA